jgi:hypothetical protein
MRRWTAGVVALLLAGCSSAGFNRTSAELAAAGPREVRESGPTSVQEALDTRPQLRLPARVAVYFAPPSGRGGPDWRWTGADKRALLSVAEGLRTDRVADLFVLPELLLTGHDLRSARIAAARLGADAVLLVRGTTDVDARFRPLDLTVVWALLGPTRRESLFVVQSVLYDVANEAVYLTAEAEGARRETRPAAWVDEERAIEKAKREALEHLAPELATRFRALKGL